MALWDDVFGTAPAAPAAATGTRSSSAGNKAEWTERLARLDALADEYKVPRDLARAVIKQESNWDINAVGDGGRAKGWFQLHPGAAKDAGIDPERRHEPDLNMLGGIRYLAQKHKQAGGNWDKALLLYNGGGDPNYLQHVKRHMGSTTNDTAQPTPQKSSSGLMARIGRSLGPSSAEAAEKPAGNVWDDVFGPVAAKPTPQPPQATPTPSAPVESPQTAPSEPSRLRAGETPSITIDIEKPSTPQAGSPAVQPPATIFPDDVQAAKPTQTWDEQMAARPWYKKMWGTPSDPNAPDKTSGVPTIEQETLEEDTTPFMLLSGLGWGKAALTAGRGLTTALGVTNPWARRGLTAAVEGAAGYAGRQTNVATGLEQPGTTGDVLSVAVPAGIRALGAARPAANPLVRRLPGAQGAQHEMMADRLRRETVRRLPVTPASRQFQGVFRSNPAPVPTAGIANTARDVLRREMTGSAGLRDPDVIKVTRGLMQTNRRRGGQVPMEQFWHDMNRVGAKVRELGWKRSGGNPEMSKLYAEMHDTLEQMAVGNAPGAQALRDAIAASRREHSVDQLRALLGQGRGIQVVKGRRLSEVRGKRMVDGFDRLVDDDRIFRETFQQGELGEIRELLEQANLLRDIPAKGAAKNMLSPRRSVPGAIGGAIGGMVGGIPGAAIGAGIGGTAHDMLTEALLSPTGRRLIRAQLENRGSLTPTALSVINAEIRKQQEGAE